MADANSFVNISTDGTVTAFDKHGVRIKELSGDLSILHRIIKINQMSAKDKGKLPNHMKLYNSKFYIIKEATGESLEVPVQHIIRFIESVNKDDVEEFVTKLLLQIPK